MYKQFCKGLKRFIQLNNQDDNLRLKIAEELLPLTDIASYRQSKSKNLSEYKKINELICNLSCYRDKYPFLVRFLWELWAYGFDWNSNNLYNSDDTFMEEKIKLIDLTSGTHYIA